MAITTLEEVADKVSSEGFHYAFTEWGDFKDVKDDKFHELRKAYVAAANKLSAYLPEVEEY